MPLPATITLENTSAAPVAGGFVAPMFGHPFAMGDIPSGAYPRFELADATPCPYTMFGATRWPDGSLRFAAFLLRVPAGVAASGTLAVTVKNTGAAHGTSSRAVSECSTGGTDLAVEVTGLDNLTGTWVSRLNQGIADGDVEILGDGPAGMVAKVRQQFMQGGADHGQLETLWYVALLQDGAGNLAGIRYLGRVCQPWYNVDTPAKSWRSFSSFLLKDGAATVRDCWAARRNVSVALRYPSALTNVPSGERSKYVEVTGNSGAMEDQTMVRFTGTTLPTGLAAGTSYFVDAARYTAHVGVHTDSGLGSQVALSGTASGDLAMVAYPYLTHFGSLYTAGPTARWDYVQAGGSAATDAPVRVRHDSNYWQNTGVVPRYENTSVAAQAEYGYELNSMWPITRYVGMTGERADLGVLPDWHVKHLISQRAADETTARGVGLKHAHAAIAVYDSATSGIVPVNNKNYPGMPSTSTTFRWSGSPSHTSGFTGPTTNTRTGLTGLGFDHMPSLSAYPYMLTGEPQFLDTMAEMAALTVASGYAPASVLTASNAIAERNATINGVTYHGVVPFNVQPRTGAWALRELGYAAALLPDGHKFKAYFTDLNAQQYVAMKAYHDHLATAFWKSSGLLAYGVEGGIMSPWMVSYMGQALAQVVRITRDANALAMLSHMVKWWDSIHTAHGSWHATSYRQIVKRTDESYVTSMDEVAYGTQSVSWSADTNRITVAPQGSYTPQNGDVLMWDRLANESGTFGETLAPAGLAKRTAYYLKNKSGNEFELSETPGGASVTFTDTRSGSAYVRMAAPPASGTFGDIFSSGGYLSNMRGMLKTAKAAGATVNQAVIDDMSARLASTSYDDSPRYNFSDAQVVTSVEPPDEEQPPGEEQPPPPEPTPAGPGTTSYYGGAWASAPMAVTYMPYTTAPPPFGEIDAGKVPNPRHIVFGGNVRVVSFEGGVRVVVFDGGNRVINFEGQ